MTSAPAFAQDEPEEARETALEVGPMVRRKLLYRSTRLEVAPFFGMTLADPYTRNGIVGASVNFHLTNEFGIGLTAGFGALQLATDLRTNMDAELNKSANRGADQLAYSHIGWMAALEGSYVPIFGKFSILDGVILNYDLHLIFGAAFIGQKAESVVPNGTVTDTSLVGNRVAPNVGIGFRFFVSDFVSINLDLRDLIYSRAELGDGSTGADQLTNNFLMSLGVSFFLPSEVKVSR
jgi:outer membrane beta-barrel protein